MLCDSSSGPVTSLTEVQFKIVREGLRLVLLEGSIPYAVEIGRRIGRSRRVVLYHMAKMYELGFMPLRPPEARGWFAVLPSTIDVFLEYALAFGEDISDLTEALGLGSVVGEGCVV